jgi:transposase
MDEGRFGRISERADCWAPHPVRPLVPRQVVRESLYAFAAVEPQHARLAWSLWPKCNTASMSLFLLEMLTVWPDRQLLLILDGAGWHKARALPVPERLRLLHLPPYCPECNPTEHIWDDVREKGFANRYFATLDAVEVGLKTQLMLLVADTARLRSLTLFPWVREGFLSSIPQLNGGAGSASD